MLKTRERICETCICETIKSYLRDLDLDLHPQPKLICLRRLRMVSAVAAFAVVDVRIGPRTVQCGMVCKRRGDSWFVINDGFDNAGKRPLTVARSRRVPHS